jgi:hypothetical protein
MASKLHWKGDRLYCGHRVSGYSVIPDQKYPQMWRVQRQNDHDD